MLTLSFADSITARGFKYVFQTSITASQMSAGAVPALMELARLSGKPAKTVGIVSDNTASPMAFTKPLREGGLEQRITEMVVRAVVD
jgi:branched-chain amino acid transport system substrate-binding protein